nr:ribonuclease H-like domain-containing protein [Tanacetum cinerariifolium]
VLVTKPHNKTPYELLLGRTHSIGFIRPFVRPVTILNTLDPLGKFDGKADDGFLVGYSVNSKAFKVFNSRTKIIQETLHINFLENQPNLVGSGPKWLFDIDTLTQSMNNQPVVARNQPNHNAGIKENLDADPQNTDVDVAFDVKENENEVHVSPNRVRDLSDEFEEFFVNSINRVNAASTPVTVVGPNATNSTNSFNVAGPSDNAVSPNFEIGGKSSFVDPSQYPDDPDMPVLEDIVYLDDEEDTRSMARMVKEQGGLTQINDEDFHTLQVKQKDDRIFISQDKYVAKILRKFSFTDVKSAITPIETEKPLLKDHDGEDVDVHIYRSMIGSLMYLTSSRPDIMFVVYTVVATLSTEAAYVAVASCCAQVLWIPNQLLDYGKKVVVTKDVIHQDLRLDDAVGGECLPTEEIFTELARMGQEYELRTSIIYLKNMVGYKIKHFIEEPSKKRVAKETLLQESFKKLKAVEVSGPHSTQDTPTDDPKKMSEEDVKNMLEIVPVSEFKVEALHVKYPFIDWEIHYEGSRSYWKIIRVGGITEAYQSFKDIPKGFDREDLDAL